MSSRGIVWLEALTPKHALLLSYVYKELKKLGINSVVTTRSYDLTANILEYYGVEHICIGKYGGRSPLAKLKASLNRQIELLRWIEEGNLNVRVAAFFTSPDATRVAYGLGIPVVSLTDSPHSDIVNRLTLPLSTRVIAPSCIARELSRYLVDEKILITFNGVFERVWIQEKMECGDLLSAMGLKPYKYCVLRPPETKAAYFKFDTSLAEFIKTARRLSEQITVVIYPRYRDQYLLLLESLKGLRNVIFLRRAVNMQCLERYAVLVLTGGATLAHEAALLGTPSIFTFPRDLEVSRFLRKKGFPLFHKPRNFSELAVKISKNPEAYRVDTKNLLSRLENPLPKIVKAIRDLVR